MSNEDNTLLDVKSPMFIFLLETRLSTEILKYELIVNDGNVKIQRLREKVQNELRTRKKLKAQFAEESKRKRIFEAALNRLELYKRNVSENSMLKKINMDVDTRQRLMEEEKCNDILKEYNDVWENYKAEYEKLPLAVVRKDAKVNLEKGRIKLMLELYKLNELKEMIKQKRAIDKHRILGVTVECAKIWMERKQKEQKLRMLIETNKSLRKELQINETKLKMLKEREKQIASKRSSQVLIPPTIDLSFMLSMCSQPIQPAINNLSKVMQNNDCDTWETASINTVMFEEMLKSNVESLMEPPQESSVEGKQHDSEVPFSDTLNETNTTKFGISLATAEAELATCSNSCHELEGLHISEKTSERVQSQNDTSARQPMQKLYEQLHSQREDFGSYYREAKADQASNTKECGNEEYEPEAKRAKIVESISQELILSTDTNVKSNEHQRKLSQIKMVVEPANITFPLKSKSKAIDAQTSSFFSSNRLYSDDYHMNDNVSGIHTDISKDVGSVSGVSIASPTWGGFTPLRRGEDDSELESIASISFRKSPQTQNTNVMRQTRPSETPVPGIGFTMLHTLHADKGKKKDKDFIKMF